MKRKLSVLLISTMMLGAVIVVASDVATEVAVDEVTTQLPSDVDVYTDETTGETVYELELDGTQDVETYTKLLSDTVVYGPGGTYTTEPFAIPINSKPSYINFYFDNTSNAPVTVRLQKQTGSTWTTVDDFTIAAGAKPYTKKYNYPLPGVPYRIQLIRTDGGLITGTTSAAWY